MSQDGVEIPYTALSAEALRAVVEEFVTREGTDYGPIVHSLDEKVAAVIGQLQREEAGLTFDPQTGTTTVVSFRR
jgi:hypothetical protein